MPIVKLPTTARETPARALVAVTTSVAGTSAAASTNAPAVNEPRTTVGWARRPEARNLLRDGFQHPCGMCFGFDVEGVERQHGPHVETQSGGEAACRRGREVAGGRAVDADHHASPRLEPVGVAASPDEDHGIGRQGEDSFGHAPQHSASGAAPAVRRHADDAMRGLLRDRDDGIGRSTVLDHDRVEHR